MMLSLKHFFTKNKNLLIILFNLVISGLFLSVFGLRYYMDDNRFFAVFIAEGEYTAYFINYFLCAVCGILQKIIYPLNAFSIFSLIVAYFAFLLLHKILSERISYFRSFFVMLFIYAFFGVNHYTSISFTMLPALLTSVGLLSIIHYLDFNYKIKGVIVGIIFTILGSLYRFNIFLVCLVIVGLYYMLFYYLNNKNDSNLLKVAKSFFNFKFILIISIIFVSTFTLNLLSNVINTSSDELKTYVEYTSLRSQIYDYKIPSYDEAKNDYDKISISRNDLEMLSNPYLDIDGAFTIDNLKKIISIRDKYYPKDSIINSCISNIKLLFGNTFFSITDVGMAIWALIIIMFLYFLFIKKQFFPITILIITISMVFLIYLWYNQRAPYRAIYPVLLSDILVLLFTFSKQSYKGKIIKNEKILLVIFSVTVFIVITPLSYKTNDSISNKFIYTDGYVETINYIENNKNIKFVIGQGVNVSYHHNYENPWIINIPEIPKNSKTFLTTQYLSSYDNKKMKEFGTDNLYKFLIDNDDVYFVDTIKSNNLNKFNTYLNEHYSNGSEIEMSLYKSFGDYRIYSVRRK